MRGTDGRPAPLSTAGVRYIVAAFLWIDADADTQRVPYVCEAEPLATHVGADAEEALDDADARMVQRCLIRKRLSRWLDKL